MFEVYRKDVTITTKTGSATYSLLPLSGELLPKLFMVAKKFNGMSDEPTPEEVLARMDEQTVKDMHALALETLVTSYPSENRENLARFVTQNLMQIFPAVIQVNLDAQK